MVFLYCPPALHDILLTSVARYSLFVLLNTKQTNKHNPDSNADPFNTNPNHNHTPTVVNSLEQIQLSIPRDGKYQLQDRSVGGAEIMNGA